VLAWALGESPRLFSDHGFPSYVKGPLYPHSLVKDYYALCGLTMHRAGLINIGLVGLHIRSGLEACCALCD
jgi:hypothetical protein